MNNYETLLLENNPQIKADMAEKNIKMNRIKEVLVSLDISQNELAGKWGKTVSHVSRICKQHNQPSLSSLREIAGILNVNVLDLIEPTEVKPKT